MQYIECVLPETDGRYHYHLPPDIEKKAMVSGTRLLVPFGRSWKVAFFVRQLVTADVPKTRAVLSLLDETSLIRPSLFKILLWISDYYQTPLGMLIKTVLPSGIHVVPRRYFKATSDAKALMLNTPSLIQGEIIGCLLEKDRMTEQELKKRMGRSGLGRSLAELKKKGAIEMFWETQKPSVKIKCRQMIALKETLDESVSRERSLQKSAPKQAEVIRGLIASGGMMPLEDFEGGSARSAVRRLLQSELIKKIEIPLNRMPRREDGPRDIGEIILNKDQAIAVATIKASIQCRRFAPYLLHGVTGSGKTEVYLQAITQTLQQNRGAILLLPEIGLTTHIAARFYERFGDQVALLHSGLSSGERYDEWRRIESGKALLAIGARSAVFAPFASLGVIIVDEEHDASYRQEEGSRYNARDVAMVRGRDEAAVVILGSATPSFESYHNSQTGKYGYLELADRVEKRPLPPVRLLDLKEKSEWLHPFFTKALFTAIQKRLDDREQILLFVNRRGFSPFLLCRSCGHTPACIRCSVSLTYHKEAKRLICHYCGFGTVSPTECLECHGTELNFMGIGTEQCEEIVRRLFPEARVARLDRDTTQRKGSHGKILSEMGRGEIDILIGTQMIAKGHDFPKVTLVGVLSADMSLHLPDFRSSERTFQLLTQVAGRAGRGKLPGEVILQTFHPEDIAIRAATTHDYLSFYEQGIKLRKERVYPPFSRLTLLLLRHPKEELVAAGAASLVTCLQRALLGDGVRILGPAPAPLLRIKQVYRYQILLKGKNQSEISRVLRIALPSWRKSFKGGFRVDIEIDPQQFV